MDNPTPTPNPDPEMRSSDSLSSADGPQPLGAEREPRQPDGRLEHPSVRSQPHVLSFRGIMAVIVAIVIAGAVISYVVWIFFIDREQRQQAANASNYPLSSVAEPSLPTAPRLEPLDRLNANQSSNLYDRQFAAEKKLNSYGPADEPGFVHIPIRQAMKMIVSKLPVRSSDAASAPYKGGGLLDAGEPNSGRVFREASK
jgi:hypothetical protein